MAQGQEGFQGWTLAEALQRTSDPDFWKAWTAAKNAAAVEAFTLLDPSSFTAGLWQNLGGEKLIGIGCAGDEETSKIFPSSWWSSSLVPENLEDSTVRERDSGARFHNVRIFPIVESPDVSARLVGLSL